MEARDIIIRPVLTEKSYAGIQSKKYVFEVDKRATKSQIKNAVEQIFDVKVEKIFSVLSIGVINKRQGRTQGYTADYKKAYVKLTADSKSIEFFDSLS